MSDIDTVLAERELARFFERAGTLDPTQVRRLGRAARRAPRRLSIETDPRVLATVGSDRWTPELDALASQARVTATELARRLSPRTRRRAVARALTNAALVVITDCVGTGLAKDLRSRLVAAWESVPGYAFAAARPQAA